MKRRTFFTGLAALVVAPAVAIGLKKKETRDGIVPQIQNKPSTLTDSPFPSNFATINTVKDGGNIVHITLTNDLIIPKVGDLACFEDEEVGYIKGVGADYRISIIPLRANILLRVRSAVPGTTVAFYPNPYTKRWTDLNS